MNIVPMVEVSCGATRFGLPERVGLSARIKNPTLHVRYWIDQGADKVFLKDKDGVLLGKPQHVKSLDYLDDDLSAKVYYCGGIRDLRSVRVFENKPFAKIVSATSLVENKKFLRNILVNNLGSVALWIDSIDGFVYTRNASNAIGKRTIDLVRSLPEIGIDEIFFCAHSGDEPLSNPDWDMIENLLDLDIKSLYVADNISNHRDFERLHNYEHAGLSGVLLGKPLYDGTLSGSELRDLFYRAGYSII